MSAAGETSVASDDDYQSRSAGTPDASAEDFAWMLNINYFGIVRGLRAFLPGMMAQSGHRHIVNTSSFCLPRQGNENHHSSRDDGSWYDDVSGFMFVGAREQTPAAPDDGGGRWALLLTSKTFLETGHSLTHSVSSPA